MKASDQAKGEFEARHIGPGESDIGAMLKLLDAPDLEQFLRRVIPANIRSTSTLKAGPFEQPLSERAALEKLRSLAAENKVFRSLLGMGYHGTITPPVIQRNILENPGWYTQYTPY
ncbi:MAG: glycine dehydrogenase (aminomethyl-transferring), partial [Deltaproteobacteria bacterium]|nr:glycine dehydrogenase (aminomethyl-transferring) [Deltaproteobacteria bacterium]